MVALSIFMLQDFKSGEIFPVALFVLWLCQYLCYRILKVGKYFQLQGSYGGSVNIYATRFKKKILVHLRRI